MMLLVQSELGRETCQDTLVSQIRSAVSVKSIPQYLIYPEPETENEQFMMNAAEAFTQQRILRLL